MLPSVQCRGSRFVKFFCSLSGQVLDVLKCEFQMDDLDVDISN